MRLALLIISALALIQLWRSVFLPTYRHGDDYYRKLQKRGFRNYSLWRPVSKVGFLYVANLKQDFWLDDFGFEPANLAAKRIK